jgi:hypothetical protein
MRGITNNNFPAFYMAAAMLDLWGYEVVNPARMDIEERRAEFNWNLNEVILDNSFTMERALARDYDEIRTCKAIILLPGWETSIGAAREIAFAVSRGIPCFLYDETKPLNIERMEPLKMSVQVTCTVEE